MYEMTASEMLRDPLIRQMLRADKISLATFATLLDTEAKRQARHAGEIMLSGNAAAEGWNGKAQSAL
jgi:hypothetical protein